MEVSKKESIMAQMDGGVGALATSSGMGATTLACMSLLAAGDAIISIGGLFGGTYSLFSETLSRFNITTSFFDVDEFEAIENAINDNTKIIFLESVGNPNMRLPDIAWGRYRCLFNNKDYCRKLLCIRWLCSFSCHL